MNNERKIPEELSKLQDHMVFLANSIYSELVYFNGDNDAIDIIKKPYTSDPNFDDKVVDTDGNADRTLFSRLAKYFYKFYRSLDLDSNKSCVDFSAANEETLKYLGFRKWDDEPDADGKYLWLVPFWLFPTIPDGTELFTIGGESFIWDSKNPSDLDSRFGCLAYGIRKDF